MLHSAQDLQGYAIEASDGNIGTVRDVYFDDHQWVVRYLVVDTGTWLDGRDVLISPMGLGPIKSLDKLVSFAGTRERVRNSPAIDLAKPVSRQHEQLYVDYYGYPYYWGGGGLWGADAYPGIHDVSGPDVLSAPRADSGESKDTWRGTDGMPRSRDDPHLRRFDAVKGYHIHASDGNIGHLHGMLIDDRTWAVRYLVVDTSNWWMGHLVLIGPHWIETVSWENSELYTTLTRKSVQEAPLYDPSLPPSRALEIALHHHYRRPGYWATEAEEASVTHAD